LKLVDSNILIYASRPDGERLRNWIPWDDVAVSVVTRIEVLGYHRLSDDERKALEALFDVLDVLPVTTEVAERAIALRRAHRMSLGDSIIAATALVENISLVTHNVSDFEGIPDLRLEDPVANA
jgi:predicted nucleic acid-binding protein